MTVNLRRLGIVFALVLFCATSLLSPVFAQQSQGNLAQRHPTATAIVAGVGTTYALKRSARYKRLHGQHLNFAERHPYMSGMGVALVTHHMLKKSRKE
jgi:hypothetical protein